MGRNAAWLNQKQVEVLRWVEDGCPTRGDEDGYERRITARALERRGLITVKGRGASWSASITKAGLAWLAARPGAPPTDAEIEELVRRVQASHGRLVIPDEPEVEMAHEQLVKTSDHSPSRPRGWRLEMRAAGPWSERRKEIVLVRHFEDLVDEEPVPVPSQVPRYHPAVKAFLADRDWQLVSKEHLARAALILQAIADEAPRRGLNLWSKAQAMLEADAYTSRASSRGHLVLGSPAGTYAIRVREVSASSSKRVEPRRWGERVTRPAWLGARTWEFVGTGILELVVETWTGSCRFLPECTRSAWLRTRASGSTCVGRRSADHDGRRPGDARWPTPGRRQMGTWSLSVASHHDPPGDAPATLRPHERALVVLPRWLPCESRPPQRGA